MNTQESVIGRVKKLLRLAESDNANEAASAAAAAQALIDKYKLEQAALEYDGAEQDNEPIREYWDEDPLVTAKRISRWKWQLALAVAKANSCKIFKISNSGNLAIIGRPSDVSAVRYLNAWMTHEVERLAKRDTKGNGRVYINNYKIGVVETIKRKLDTQYRDTQAAFRADAARMGNTNALVRAETAIAKIKQRRTDVELYAQFNLNLQRIPLPNPRKHAGAREHGRMAGEEINLGNRARGALEA